MSYKYYLNLSIRKEGIHNCKFIELPNPVQKGDQFRIYSHDNEFLIFGKIKEIISVMDDPEKIIRDYTEIIVEAKCLKESGNSVSPTPQAIEKTLEELTE